MPLLFCFYVKQLGVTLIRSVLPLNIVSKSVKGSALCHVCGALYSGKWALTIRK